MSYNIRRSTITAAALITALSLAACNTEPSGDMTDVPDTQYLEQLDAYGIGALFYYEGYDEYYVEICFLCEPGGTVVDCGTNTHVRDFDESSYMMQHYSEAVADFYGYLTGSEGNVFSRVTFVIDEAVTTGLPPDLQVFAQDTFGEPDPDYVMETRGSFDAFLAASHEMYQDIVPEEQVPGTVSPDMPYVFQVASSEQYLQILPDAQEIYLINDMELSLGGITHDLTIRCEGHAVTLVDVPQFPATVTFENASAVDMSEVWFPEDLSEYAEGAVTGMMYDAIRIEGTPQDQIVMSPCAHDMDPIDFQPFDDYLVYNVNEETGNVTVSYIAPAMNYEAQHEQDLALINAVLTEGNYSSISDGQQMIYTDVVIDIGDTVLPNTDYAPICLAPGAHLTITGTLTITGGKFEFRVCEYDQLDITGLTIVKQHPSPDMMRIEFDPEVGIDQSLVTLAGGRGGTISYSVSDRHVDITMW